MTIFKARPNRVLSAEQGRRQPGGGRRFVLALSGLQAMVKSRRNEIAVAYALMAPFIIVYGALFVYPSVKMFELSFTDAPLIGEGAWVGFKNFWRLQSGPKAQH